MKTRLSPSAKRRIHKKKGDLLDRKWMTYFLAVILLLLIGFLVVLSSPEYKKYFMDGVTAVFYGKKHKAPRPQASPAHFQTPLPSAPNESWQLKLIVKGVEMGISSLMNVAHPLPRIPNL